MFIAERQQKILDALSLQSFISLSHLADLLQVSVMTVRRDVAKLSSRGQIIAVRGGVKSLSVASGELQPKRPASLLRAALEQIGDKRVIFLDGGEACRELVRYIPWREDMTAITNDFQTASEIITQSPGKFYFIGGELRRSDSTFHHRLALDALNVLNFELVFLSPDSWDASGAWHQEKHRQTWYQTLFARSGNTVLIARSRDLGRNGLYKLYPLEKANVILTDHAEFPRLADGINIISKLIISS